MATTVQALADVSRETAETCSRCDKPLDTTLFPKWCKACRQSYNKEYKALQKQLSETRGFCAGVSAAKDLIASEFERHQGVMFSGREAAHMVRVCNGPELPA